MGCFRFLVHDVLGADEMRVGGKHNRGAFHSPQNAVRHLWGADCNRRVAAARGARVHAPIAAAPTPLLIFNVFADFFPKKSAKMPIMKQTKANMVARFTALALMATFIEAVGAFLSKVRNLSFTKAGAVVASVAAALYANAAHAAAASLVIPLWGQLNYDDETYVISGLTSATATGAVFTVFVGVFTVTLVLVALRKISMSGKKTT